MFASTSFLGHRHVVSGKRLNPVELRKAIKIATIVNLYESRVIDLFLQVKKGLLRKHEELIIELLKDIEPPNFLIEKEFLALLKEKRKIPLRFSIPNIYGFGIDEKKWMDYTAKIMNQELAKKGYLKKEENGRYLPIEVAIKSLESKALEIKAKVSDFETKKKDIIKKIYANL